MFGLGSDMNYKPVAKHFRPGEKLFTEGQPSDCIIVIQKGTLSIRKMKGSGFIEIGRVYSNEVIGELSFFDRQPRSASAVALSEVEALLIHFDALDKIYKNIPPYFQTIMACVAERLRKANDRIQKLQKNVQYDEKSDDPSEEPDTASVLAAVSEDAPAASEAGADLSAEEDDSKK